MVHEAENEVTQVQFAQMRGVTPPLVTRWKQAGRLVMNAEGTRVLARESIELLESTLDPSRGGNRIGNVLPIEAKLPPPASAGRSIRDHDYHAAAREEKVERAALLKLERLEREGTLVLRAQVETEAQTLATQAREAMMSIPDRIASQLAAESDVERVRLLLDAEIRHVVNQLAIYANPLAVAA